MLFEPDHEPWLYFFAVPNHLDYPQMLQNKGEGITRNKRDVVIAFVPGIDHRYWTFEGNSHLCQDARPRTQTSQPDSASLVDACYLQHDSV
jgi:hypothetical protein